MFDGIYFQFPKLGFLLFFFLACEALCPLRTNPLYFPRTLLFGEVGVKPSLWLWIAKWAMISFLIVALMSPVHDRKIMHHGGGWDILLVVDPALINPESLTQITSFIESRPDERIALWIPENTVVPLTYEHDVLKSIVMQTPKQDASTSVNRSISRFFATSGEGRGMAVILSNNPKSFVNTVPQEIQTAVIAPKKETRWLDTLSRTYPPYKVQLTSRYFDYYYVYPLFLGFLAMLAYLYGRNQKGMK